MGFPFEICGEVMMILFFSPGSKSKKLSLKRANKRQKTTSFFIELLILQYFHGQLQITSFIFQHLSNWKMLKPVIQHHLPNWHG